MCFEGATDMNMWQFFQWMISNAGPGTWIVVVLLLMCIASIFESLAKLWMR